MRRFLSLAKVSARESLEEALSPVLFLFAYLSAHLLPVFHYHRFGEVARLPRECAMSAMLVCGTWFSAAAALRILSRELGSGTAAATIAGGAGRGEFFVAKVAGVWGSLFVFAVGSFFSAALSCTTALAGAALFDEGAQDTATWGPGLAIGAISAIAAFVAAAAMNRFKGRPFASTACKCLAASQVLAFVAASAFAEGAWILAASLAVPWIALFMAAMVLATIGAAAAVWLPQAAATAATVVAAAAFVAYPLPALVPTMGTFWLSDAAAEGSFSIGMCARIAGAWLCLTALWTLAGVSGIKRKDIA